MRSVPLSTKLALMVEVEEPEPEPDPMDEITTYVQEATAFGVEAAERLAAARARTPLPTHRPAHNRQERRTGKPARRKGNVVVSRNPAKLPNQ